VSSLSGAELCIVIVVLPGGDAEQQFAHLPNEGLMLSVWLQRNTSPRTTELKLQGASFILANSADIFPAQRLTMQLNKAGTSTVRQRSCELVGGVFCFRPGDLASNPSLCICEHFLPHRIRINIKNKESPPIEWLQ